MTIVANTFLTFGAKGIREQLSDVIYNTDPDDTPLTSLISKARAKSTLNEWQGDVLGAVDGANAQLEGDDIASFPAITATVRLGNYQQISRKLLLVSDTEEIVDKAGRDGEISYQTALRGTEMKRDVETILFSTQGGTAGSSTTARTTAALGIWTKTNQTMGTGAAAAPTWTSGVPLVANARVDGTQAAFTETILKATILLMFNSGAKLKYLFLGPVNKARFSGFAGIATKTLDIAANSQANIVAAADVYVSDYGTLKVMPSRLQRERDAHLIDPDFLEIQHLRPFKVVDLAKTGDATKKMLIVEWGLKVRAEKANGAAFDLTTT